MEPVVREHLAAYFTAYLSQQSQRYFDKYHYDKVHFSNGKRIEYRPPNEINQIYSEALEQAKQISEELLDELEAQGIDNLESMEEITRVLNDIMGKFYSKLDKIISDRF